MTCRNSDEEKLVVYTMFLEKHLQNHLLLVHDEDNRIISKSITIRVAKRTGLMLFTVGFKDRPCIQGWILYIPAFEAGTGRKLLTRVAVVVADN